MRKKYARKIIKSLLAYMIVPLVKALPYARLIIGEANLKLVKDRGEGVAFEGGGILLNREKIHIGNHVFLGRNYFIQAAGGVTIGDYTHISRNVTIHTSNHNIEGDLLPYDRKNIIRKVVIGNYVWIGMNVNILPGVTIGDGAVVGMGTTVTKDVQEGEIVVGTGQRVIGERDSEHVKRLVKARCFLEN